MEVIVQPTAEEATEVAARIVGNLIRRKPDAVLGLATGSTPVRLYQKLVEKALDWSRITVFNLDEYVGLPQEHPQSYRVFMRENLFNQTNIRLENTHIPDGNAADLPASCRAYEEKIREAGGVDLQLLGIGSDGHIGFNEPTSSLASRTRIKTLTPRTRADNARFFGGEDAVPHHVVTMGIGTILESKKILLLAFGEGKAEALAGAVEGALTATNPASALQMHEKAIVCADAAAASRLARLDYYRWVYENKPQWQKE